MDSKCDACNGQDVDKFAKESMKKYGWYAHYVFDGIFLLLFAKDDEAH